MQPEQPVVAACEGMPTATTMPIEGMPTATAMPIASGSAVAVAQQPSGMQNIFALLGSNLGAAASQSELYAARATQPGMPPQPVIQQGTPMMMGTEVGGGGGAGRPVGGTAKGHTNAHASDGFQHVGDKPKPAAASATLAAGGVGAAAMEGAASGGCCALM